MPNNAGWTNLDAALEALEAELTDVARGLTVRAWNSVLSKSPQFHGRFVASWNYCINEQVYVDRSEYVTVVEQHGVPEPGQHPVLSAKTAGDTADISIANAENMFKDQAFKLGDVVWFCNGVDHGAGPYSQDIEDGSIRLRSGQSAWQTSQSDLRHDRVAVFEYLGAERSHPQKSPDRRLICSKPSEIRSSVSSMQALSLHSQAPRSSTTMGLSTGITRPPTSSSSRSTSTAAARSVSQSSPKTRFKGHIRVTAFVKEGTGTKVSFSFLDWFTQNLAYAEFGAIHVQAPAPDGNKDLLGFHTEHLKFYFYSDPI